VVARVLGSTLNRLECKESFDYTGRGRLKGRLPTAYGQDSEKRDRDGKVKKDERTQE
jgi:hypothetical protein